MNAPKPSMLKRLSLALAVAGGLAGCASQLDVTKKTVDDTQTVKQGTQAPPFRSITGFSSSLRCMDNLMIDYGVRDVSMLVEDIVDQTKKVNAGTRDMLISAVSDMTRRSRSIRVVAFGRDATNVISFLASAQRQSAYEVTPQFDIKGSVSQFDENVIRNQKDAGLSIQPFLNLGVSRDAATSILGLDLSVLTTDDMSILAGVTSRNSVVILKQGSGNDADAAYHKFGVSFSMSLSKSEGQAQALRGLVELAVIELMGKLTKTPYWSCLGADPKASDEIRAEMSDWYYAMATSRVELIGYFQNQLRRRGFYEGSIDGQFNPAIDEAIGNYRVALGLSKQSLLDEAFFNAYLTADHTKIPRPDKPATMLATATATAPAPAAAAAPAPALSAAAPAAAAARPTPTPTPAPQAEPMKLLLATQNGQTNFASGESISLTVRPNRDAYVYCYLLDEQAKVTRFFPNRFAKDPLITAAQALQLPGKMRFQLAIKSRGARESIACFATPKDVLAQLSDSVVGIDFEPLPVNSLEQVRAAFVAATRGALAQEILHVQAR
jgi:Domain of unknown function (DUF4384)